MMATHMKILLLVLGILSVLSISAFADPGQYACETVLAMDTTPDKVLNSLGCDTSKPFSVSSFDKDTFTACCVQK